MKRILSIFIFIIGLFIAIPTFAAVDIIVDNADSGYVDSGWTYWTPDGYDGDLSYTAAGSGLETATWTPTIVDAGEYNVYVRWTTHSNRATNAPYTVNYNGGSELFVVDQELLADQATTGGSNENSGWYLLGAFDFLAGVSGSVVLSDDANEYVIADAVRFESTNFTVDDDLVECPTASYTSIQDAIDAAAVGQTITVCEGTYSENLTINTEGISIIGTNRNAVIVDTPMADGDTYGVAVNADDVLLKKMTLKNGAIDDAVSRFQVKASHIDGFSIDRVTLKGNGSNHGYITGLDLNTMTNASVSRVTVQDYSKNGIAVTSKFAPGDPITDGVAFHNVTSKNNGKSDGWAGMAFYTTAGGGGIGNITNIAFSGTNTIKNNRMGMFFEGTTGSSTLGVGGGTLDLGATTFENNSVQDIVNGQLGNVDATSAIFTGAVDGFDIEDRIFHAIDAAGVGVVTWEALTHYVTPNSFNALAGTTAASIQRGIDASQPGDTLMIGLGTYVDDAQVVVDKDMTINGEVGSKPKITPGFDTGSSSDARGWWLIESGIMVDIDNLEFDGLGHLVYQAIRDKGEGSFTRLDFKNIKYNESGPEYSGVGVAAFGTGPRHISDSTFEEMGRIGTLYFGALLAGSQFEDNTYTGKGDGDWLDYALDISNGADVDVDNLVVSGNTGVADVDGSTSAGILVTTFFGPGTAATITNSSITGNTTGIAVGYDGSDTSTVVANDNLIAYNDTGVESTAPAVNAENNDWGDCTGPFHASNPSGLGNPVSDFVDFDPWVSECLAEIHGMKYEDINGNGVRDIDLEAPENSEPGIEGWKIFLKNLDTNDVIFTFTDEDGNYSFLDLVPGNYRISEKQKSGWVQTEPVSPNKYTVALLSGDIITELEFGNFKLAEVHGVKYKDINGNGVRNVGEDLLPNWKINLSGPQGVQSVFTNAQGEYSFYDLGPGEYTLTEKMKNGWGQSQPGPQGGYKYVFTPESGSVLIDADFGNYQFVTIKGRKYHDKNLSGTRNPGESWLKGWTIKLINLQTGEILTDVTNRRGRYSFTQLAPGNYIVQEVLQSGWIPVNPASSIHSVSVVSNQVLSGVNFGNATLQDKIAAIVPELPGGSAQIQATSQRSLTPTRSASPAVFETIISTVNAQFPDVQEIITEVQNSIEIPTPRSRRR